MKNRAIPDLSILSPEQKKLVHDRALQILEKTGVRVDCPKAAEIFAGAGAPPDSSGRVRIKPHMVEKALSSVPKSVPIFNRNGDPAFVLGRGAERIRFGMGVTNLYYQEPGTDETVAFARRHMSACTRLANALDGFDMVSTLGVVQDAPPETSDLYATLEMAANTVKPLVILVSDEAALPSVLDMMEALFGDVSQKPFFIPYFNPITPLVLNTGTTDKMMEAADRGIPFIFSNYGMAGASTPITIAGTAGLMTAELLAGLVLAQSYKPGTRLVLGSLPASFDMRTMATYYSSLGILLNLACAEMMDFYQVPHAGTSGSGIGWGPDLLADGGMWFNHLTAGLGKAQMAPFVGGNLGSMAFSPSTAVLSDVIIRQVLEFSRGFSLEEAEFALQDIDMLGPGGDFLGTDLTYERFKTSGFASGVWPVYTYDGWMADNRPGALDMLTEKTKSLLAETSAPEDHDALIQKGEAFIGDINPS